jgi:hypothetical protein
MGGQCDNEMLLGFAHRRGLAGGETKCGVVWPWGRVRHQASASPLTVCCVGRQSDATSEWCLGERIWPRTCTPGVELVQRELRAAPVDQPLGRHAVQVAPRGDTAPARLIVCGWESK